MINILKHAVRFLYFLDGKPFQLTPLVQQHQARLQREGEDNVAQSLFGYVFNFRIIEILELF